MSYLSPLKEFCVLIVFFKNPHTQDAIYTFYSYILPYKHRDWGKNYIQTIRKAYLRKSLFTLKTQELLGIGSWKIDISKHVEEDTPLTPKR